MSKTDPAFPPPFVYVIYIDSPLEKVWAGLTTPEFTQRYWGGLRATSDWRVGSPVAFVKPDGTVDLKGEVLVCDPPRELSYSWDLANASGGQGGLSSRVTFKLAAPWGSTQLTIVHEGLAPGSRAAAMITQGWPAILSSLKSLLERGAPLPTTYKACA